MLQLTPSFFVYAGVVASAVVMAAFADKRDKAAAFICAAALLASWLIHIGSYTPWAIERAARSAGIALQAIDVWSVSNMAVGLVVLALARSAWWGIALFGLLFCGCINDLLYWSGRTDWRTFGGSADVLFLAEESIFFVLGGRNAADSIANGLDRGWGLFPVRGTLSVKKALSRRAK